MVHYWLNISAKCGIALLPGFWATFQFWGNSSHEQMSLENRLLSSKKEDITLFHYLYTYRSVFCCIIHMSYLVYWGLPPPATRHLPPATCNLPPAIHHLPLFAFPFKLSLYCIEYWIVDVQIYLEISFCYKCIPQWALAGHYSRGRQSLCLLNYLNTLSHAMRLNSTRNRLSRGGVALWHHLKTYIYSLLSYVQAHLNHDIYRDVLMLKGDSYTDCR